MTTSEPFRPTADGFRFYDTHVHFWDHSVPGLHWPFLQPGFDHPRLRGMHRLDAPAFTDVEFAAQAGNAAPQRVVHVQSCTESSPGLETRWLQSIADERGAVGAIVARARLAEPDVASVLRANQAPLLRGVRDMSAPNHIGSNEFTEGFASAASMGLSVELLVPHPQFGDVIELAKRFPDTCIVVGHAGQPEHRDREYFTSWSEALLGFRGLSNIVVKISALASGADPNWTAASIQPWVEQCIDVFTPDRAMFASNWPIDRMYGTYERLIDAYRTIATGYDIREQQQLFHRSAGRIYGLETLDSPKEKGTNC